MITVLVVWEETRVYQIHMKNNFKLVNDSFYRNYIKLDHKKCHHMCINKNTDQVRFIFEDFSLAIIKKEEILGVIIENFLSISQFQFQFQNSISMMI